jgi:hypothetical protein
MQLFPPPERARPPGAAALTDFAAHGFSKPTNLLMLAMSGRISLFKTAPLASPQS